MLKILYLYACLLVLIGAEKRPEGESDDVSINCLDCERKYGGVVGRNITLRYTFTKEFDRLTITYNFTKVLVVRGAKKYGVDTGQFEDDRLKTSRTFRSSDPKQLETFTLQLVGLTLDDNECSFEYKYEKDIQGPNGLITGVYTLPSTFLKVRKPEDRLPSTGDEGGDSTLIIIIVVVSIVVLIGCLLIVLLKSGVFTHDSHHAKDPHRFEHVESGESYPLSQPYPDEKIYATPDNRSDEASAEQLTEYAEVGPGGGRLGNDKERNDKPAPSVYAQVKTESGNYPDLNNTRRGDRL